MALSDTFAAVKELVANGDVRVSDHGYDELTQDNILVSDIIEGLDAAVLVEDYPDFAKGPCVLVLEFDADASPIHVVWGIPRGQSRPAVVVTAYRPDPGRWSAEFTKRRK